MLSRVIFVCILAAVAADSEFISIEAENAEATVMIQATNNTNVPSVLYIADAVECLTEAYSIYADDANRAIMYAALFEERHNGTWNVVVGYTALYLHSSVYIEAEILGEDSRELKKDSKEDGKLYLIFSTD